jgi:hypothetical protein
VSEQPTTPAPEALEVATLRRTVAELLQKNSTRKDENAALTAANAALQAANAELQTALHQLSVAGPLKAMAEDISINADLFLEQFGKSHKVELVKGQLTLLTTDGKPVLKGDKPVPFERQALIELLTSGDDAQSKVFKSILIASRASGAATTAGRVSKPTSEPKPQFGLR